MRILVIHNRYQIQGGEDAVFSNEVALLSKDNDVHTYVASNSGVSSFLSKVVAGLNTVFSLKEYLKIKILIKKIRPDIVHVHNYFATITPAVFFACRSAKVPVVHTLHNFRAICPTATLSLKGEVIERSISESSFWTINERVYKGSLIGSCILSIMVEVHKFIGTWKHFVDGYIALTDFSKEKYVEAGWPRSKIFVKPNFCSVISSNNGAREPFALYVGRLSEEKGIDFILESFARSNLNLKIAGDGPLLTSVQESSGKNIEYLGCLSKKEVSEYMRRASCLVMASTWYEGFPMVIVEAFSNGLPVVVPTLGNMSAIVEDTFNGLQYEPKNSTQFMNSVKQICENQEFRSLMSSNAELTYELNYSEEINYSQLINIYDNVIKASRKDA